MYARASALLFLAFAACGPRYVDFKDDYRPPPERKSPVMSPTGGQAFLDATMVLDQRRDGVFALQTDRGLEVQRFDGAAVTLLFTASGGTSLSAQLVSRSDSAVALATNRRLYVFDGSQLNELTTRLSAAYLSAQPLPAFGEISALDLSEDGTVTVLASVAGQGDFAPFWQLCVLGADGHDGCEGVDSLTTSASTEPDAIVVQDARTYLLIDEQLHVREAGKAWTPVTPERVIDLRSLEGGRIAYLHRFANSYGNEVDRILVVLGASGAQERRLSAVWAVLGHSAKAVWSVGVDSQLADTCQSFSGYCTEPLLWAQLVVWRVDQSVVEVGHLDSSPGDELFQKRALPLSDGSLRVELGSDVYTFAGP